MKSQLTRISKLYETGKPVSRPSFIGTGFSKGGKDLRSVEEDTPDIDEVIPLDYGEDIG